MTLKQAKRSLSKLGITLSKRDGEYRVNYRAGKESSAYYTNDLTDAYDTGRDMALRGTPGVSYGNPKDEVEWHVFSYDVWGNKKDGFEVNDKHKLGVEYGPPDLTDSQAIQLAKWAGLLKKSVRRNQLLIEGDDITVYFTERRTGEPLGEMQREWMEGE